MEADNYPTNLSGEEGMLGFQRVEVLNPDGVAWSSSTWVPVVAKILGESDMVVKTLCIGAVIYKHKRFGWFEVPNCDATKISPRWIPVGNDIFSDPKTAVIEANFHSDEIDGPKFIPAKAEFKVG